MTWHPEIEPKNPYPGDPEEFSVMLRPRDCDAILAALEAALNKGVDFGPGIPRWLVEEAGRRIEAARPAPGLTCAEKAEVDRETAQRFALTRIAEIARWYADVHAGPELEVHHALKVEVLDIAQRALSGGPEEPQR